MASPQQQIIQRKRIHLPQNPPAGNSTGPVYANQSIASGPSNPLSNSVRLTGSPRNSPASSNSIGSSSFYSRKLSRRPSSWPPTASSSSFRCPTCWPVSAKTSQQPAQTNEPDRSRDVLLVLAAQQHQQLQQQQQSGSAARAGPLGRVN